MANPHLRAPSRRRRADNDNYDRDSAIRRARVLGTKLRELAADYGLGVSAVRRICDDYPPLTETQDSVIRQTLVLGTGGSTSCFYQPVRLPRVTFIDGPYMGAAA